MEFEFATCNKDMALHHLKKAYPNHEINEENTKKIMQWIIKDIVRIQDPDFHQPPQVSAGKNWVEDSETRKIIQNDFKEFHKTLKRKNTHE